MPVTATAAVKAGTAIAQTIAGIVDQTKRRNFEQSLALLSNQQLNDLNLKLLAAKTETDRLNVLSNAVVEYAAENTKAKENKQIVVYIIVGVLAIALLGAAILLSKKKKE